MIETEEKIASSFQEKLVKIMERCMRPIARMLLRSGIGYREFSSICKRAFVDVATHEYGLRGRPTNISRVAIMTGLTRKEVKKIRDNLDKNNDPAFLKTNPAAHVLHFWHLDQEFCNEHGVPLELNLEGKSPSFFSLAKKYGGDIPPVALLKELQRAKAVETADSGRLHVLKRQYIPYGPDERLLTSLQNQLLAHLKTIDNNNSPKITKDPESAFLDRIVYSVSLNNSALPRFRRMSKQHCLEFLNMLDDWIAANEDTTTVPAKGSESATGIGVFYFEGHEELK